MYGERSSRTACFCLLSREARDLLHEDGNVCADCYLLSSVPRATMHSLCFTFVSFSPPPPLALSLFASLIIVNNSFLGPREWGDVSDLALSSTWHLSQRAIVKYRVEKRNKRILRPPLPNCIGNLHGNRAESGAKYRSVSIDISGRMRANIPRLALLSPSNMQHRGIWSKDETVSYLSIIVDCDSRYVILSG